MGHSILVDWKNHIMKCFVLAAVVSLASASPAVPFTAFASGPVVAHAPVAHHALHAPVHHAVAHHAPVHHAVVHHAPVHHAVHNAPAYHQPHYGYEKPKHNC